MNVITTFKEFQILYLTTKEKLDIKNEQMNVIKENVYNSLLINNIKLSPKIIIRDENGNKYKIEDILTVGKEKLIFRFHESYCSPCIKKYISRIKKCVDKSGNNNVIILAAFSNPITLKEKFDVSGIKTFFYDEKILGFDSNEIPYLYTIDKSLISCNGFIPNEDDLDFMEKFTLNILNVSQQ
jgi:hypothetical protein